MNRSKIGWHVGPGGNMRGWGDAIRQSAAVGAPVVVMSADAYGPLHEGKLVADNWGVDYVGCFRLSKAGQNNGHDYDVPPYGADIPSTWDYRWGKILERMPPEFNRATWYAPINEVNKLESDWIGRYAAYAARQMMKEGYRSTWPAWSSGEPEFEHWQTSGMLELLALCAEHPDSVSICLHEYSYTLDLRDDYGYKIGRFQHLFKFCDDIGLARPNVIIKEFGWTLNDVATGGEAINQLQWASDLYGRFENILGAGIWYLGPSFGGIADKAQPLIAPWASAVSATDHGQPTNEIDPNLALLPGDDGGPVTPPPTTNDCAFVDQETRQYVLLVPDPLDLSDEEKATLYQWTEFGIPGETEGIASRHIFSYSAQPAMKLVRDGAEGSRLYVVDGERIGTGLDEAWILDQCPELLSRTKFISLRQTQLQPFQYEIYPVVTGDRRITQAFGANPQNYEPFGLPGHEGVDFRAPHGVEIVAVTAGVVTDVVRERLPASQGGHNYGIHVRVEHERSDGRWQTIYAHLDRAVVDVGQQVSAGQLLGLADNTGNSYGSHLHNGLKRLGHTYTDPSGTSWPYNFHDPTPYVQPFLAPQVGNAGIGLHLQADGGNYLLIEPLKRELALLQPQTLKFLSSHSPQHVGEIASLHRNATAVVRPYLSFGNRRISPQQFYDWTISDTQRTINALLPHIPQAKIFIEIHNEQNLTLEGWGTSWANGSEFATWWTAVVGLYRSALPNYKYIWPALSPGGSSSGIRLDAYQFLDQARASIAHADHVAVHCYWTTGDPFSNALRWLDHHNQFNKPLWVTEASDKTAGIGAAAQGIKYYEFWQELRKRPLVQGVHFYVSSALDDAFAGERWITPDGKQRGIAAQINQMRFQ